jgi:hypothetical protein
MSETALPSGSVLADKAIASAWEVWARMRPLVVSAMIASAVVGAAFAYFKTSLVLSSNNAFPRGTLLGLIHILLQSAIAAPLAVATHPLILKGEPTPGIIAMRKPYHWIFFAWLCGLGIAPFLLMGLSLSTGSRALALVPAVAGLIVGINSVLLFPAIAIEAPSTSWLDRFKTSWKQMRGHFWLFLRAILLALIPLFVSLLLFLGGIIVIGLVLARLPVPIQVWQPLLAGIGSVFQPASILIGAAVASWLYYYVRARSIA